VNSIGIWWDRIRNGTSEPQIHLDLNLWAAKQTENNYIEFGFKIKEYAIINKLYIFLPFQFSKNDFEDKTRYFFDSQDLSCLLFNQEMTFVGNGSSSCRHLTKRFRRRQPVPQTGHDDRAVGGFVLFKFF